MSVLDQVSVLFILLVIGFVARKVKVIDDAALAHFSSLLINITLPCLVLASLQKPFSRELLGESAITFGLSLALYAVFFAFAAVYPRLIRAGKKEGGVHAYAVIFSNAAFMGFPVVEAILGTDALFHLTVYNIAFNLLAFSFGALLVARGGSRPLVVTWRTFASPVLIATFVGFVCFLASVSFPAPLLRSIKMAGDITSPLSMIVIGAVLGRMDIGRVLGSPRYYLTSIVRLVVVPAAVYGALYACGFRGRLLLLPTIVAAMPVAANTTIMAEVYGGDVEGSSSLVFISTLLCVVTIPILALLLASA